MTRARLIITACALIITSCVIIAVAIAGGPDDQVPTRRPLNTPGETPSGIPTVRGWVNQTCSPEGAKAKTISGGDIVCKRVGSDPVPEWHAQGPS